MKVAIYEELKYFGETDAEAAIKGYSEKSHYMRNNGIQVSFEAKDYSRLISMIREY